MFSLNLVCTVSTWYFDPFWGPWYVQKTIFASMNQYFIDKLRLFLTEVSFDFQKETSSPIFKIAIFSKHFGNCMSHIIRLNAGKRIKHFQNFSLKTNRKVYCDLLCRSVFIRGTTTEKIYSKAILTTRLQLLKLNLPHSNVMTWKLQLKLIWIALKKLSEPHFCFENWSKLVQTCLNLRNCLNLSEMVQICLIFSTLKKSKYFSFRSKKINKQELTYILWICVVYFGWQAQYECCIFSKIILVLYPNIF